MRWSQATDVKPLTLLPQVHTTFTTCIHTTPCSCNPSCHTQ